MKRIIYIILLPLLLASGCGRESEGSQESGLYKRYASQSDLSVAQVCGFSLGEEVKVDVVLLQAESDEAWRQMKEELDIRGDAGTVSWLGDSEEPAQRVEWDGRPVTRVIASHDRQAVGFYRIETEEQYDALIEYQLKGIEQ